MIDSGLLWSLVLIAAALAVALAAFPPRREDRAALLDRALWPAMAGLFVGRVTAVMLDDPAAVTRLGDVLVLRGGVEFWAGVAAGVGVGMWSARKIVEGRVERLADAAPYALIAYAAYEAGCLVRSGCFGPRSAIGLVAPGLTSRVVPVGLLVAVVIAALALLVRRVAGGDPISALWICLFGLSATRAVASIWLPKIGSGPTRQHLESIAVAGLAGLAFAARVVRVRMSPRRVRVV